MAPLPSLDQIGASESIHCSRVRELRCYALMAWRNTDPPFLISPLIAVQFVMRETLDPIDFRRAWPDFMTGYQQHFRAAGLRAANAFALRKLSDLGTHSNRSGQ